MCKKTVIAFIALWCFLSVHVGVVKGRYILQVTISGYINPFQRCAGCASLSRCCDTNFNTNSCFGNRRCDTFFFFCLRPIDSNVRNGTGCSYSGNLTSEVNENDATINFDQTTFLGLDNPLTLEGLTDAWNGVQIYIEARDDDGNDQYQLIDVWMLNDNLPVGVLSNIQEFTGFNGIMNLTVRAIVLCVQNFTGLDCTQCIRGLTGTMCDKNIDDCAGRTCTGNGQCIDGLNTFTCECNPGFTGPECEDNINECIDPGVNCSGNGRCVDEIGSYSCNCSAGYNGTDCEINIDDCSPDPCGSNGRCIYGVDSFTCNCATGYTGTLCDSDIDECLSNPCGMNGQCENYEGSFNCSCNPGFTGDLCQIDIDDCVGVNCSENTVCVDGVNSFMCQAVLVELRGSKQLIPIVGGAISGGVLVIVIVLVLIIIIIVAVKYKTRNGIKHGTMDIEMKENKVYGVSMATPQAERQQPQMPDNALISRNVCYATTQHMEIVDNECYSCIPEKYIL